MSFPDFENFEWETTTDNWDEFNDFQNVSFENQKIDFNLDDQSSIVTLLQNSFPVDDDDWPSNAQKLEILAHREKEKKILHLHMGTPKIDKLFRKSVYSMVENGIKFKNVDVSFRISDEEMSTLDLMGLLGLKIDVANKLLDMERKHVIDEYAVLFLNDLMNKLEGLIKQISQ